MAQGTGNVVAPFFGGFAATGAIARTATNIRSGGRSPFAAVVHAVVVLLAVLLLAPLLGRLPMASLAALLLFVAWNMSELDHFAHVVKVAPRHDVAVLLTCFLLTVLFDMVVAVSVGIVMAALLFMSAWPRSPRCASWTSTRSSSTVPCRRASSCTRSPARSSSGRRRRPNHRYSASRDIPKLRKAIADWYSHRYGVSVDPDKETIVVIGVKEGLSHLALAVVEPGDMALVPSPSYPIHLYSMIIAGANVRSIPLLEGTDLFRNIVSAYEETWPKPKFLVLSFPHNPTCLTVDLDFFARVVEFAKARSIIVIHDFAYSDLTFDGYVAPSFLQVPGAKDVAVEFLSLSKSYNMPGWGFLLTLGGALAIAAAVVGVVIVGTVRLVRRAAR